MGTRHPKPDVGGGGVRRELNLHLTPNFFSIFAASSSAFLLLLYQMATFAPASA